MSTPAGAPTAWIAGCLDAQSALDAALAGLTDDEARRPSLLPDWSVGHVLSHIARNAESVVWRLEGAAIGERRDQYPGGLEQRSGDIASGATRSAHELVADVARTSAAVARAVTELPNPAWDAPSRTSRGVIEDSRAVVFSRWREVVVHHRDLGLGAVPFPEDLLAAWLPNELARLAERTDPGALLAWVLGRGPAPELGPW